MAHAKSHPNAKELDKHPHALSFEQEPHLPLSEVREDFSNLVNRVVYGGDRIVLCRHGKSVAALISYEDLKFFEELEDSMDVQAARSALKTKQATIPWERIRHRKEVYRGL